MKNAAIPIGKAEKRRNQMLKAQSIAKALFEALLFASSVMRLSYAFAQVTKPSLEMWSECDFVFAIRPMIYSPSTTSAVSSLFL